MTTSLTAPSPQPSPLAVVDASSDNDFDPVADQTVSATTTDNDVAGFTIVQSGGSTAVAETGTTDTFTVVLNAQPASNVCLNRHLK
ncbi:MAG: hypothetical protein ACJZ2F_02115 [Acidimicrobiales bacterium]